MRLNFLFALIAAAAIAASVFELHAATASVLVTRLDLDGTPATLYRPAARAAAPVILIAHGFAGSQQLMQSFALTFARNGYVAVTFDFPGHGQNPAPLTGSITDVDGATRTLLQSLAHVARAARAAGDGRLAVLGHSMASDIVVRFAQTAPDVTATIAVSMFSPAVTASAPRDLLIIVGDWETMLKREALRALNLGMAHPDRREGKTYGDFAAGNARRVAFSPHVEHVGVLFSEDGMREALSWLDASFGVRRSAPPRFERRGPWILLLIAGVVLLARPLSTLLPRVASLRVGANLGWRRLWLPMLVPMILTPLVLRVLPTHFLPVLVGDYLAAHFLTYGLVTAICLFALRGWGARSARHTRPVALAGASIAVVAYGFIALVWPVDAFVTSFLPGRQRILLILAMLMGTLCYFLSDEWLTRGEHPARGAYLASKVALLMSLAIAVALDLQRLFFLIIIIPVIVLFFVIYGLFSKWTYDRTRHPWVAGIANAIAFAWAIGVTFPLLAG